MSTFLCDWPCSLFPQTSNPGPIHLNKQVVNSNHSIRDFEITGVLMGVLSFLLLGSLPLEAPMTSVDVNGHAHSCDCRCASTTVHGKGQRTPQALSGLVFTPSLLFTTASAGLRNLCTPGYSLSAPHLALGTRRLETHDYARLLQGFCGFELPPVSAQQALYPLSHLPSPWVGFLLIRHSRRTKVQWR